MCKRCKLMYNGAFYLLFQHIIFDRNCIFFCQSCCIQRVFAIQFVRCFHCNIKYTSNKLSTTIITFIHNSMWEHWKRKLQPYTNTRTQFSVHIYSQMHTHLLDWRRAHYQNVNIHRAKTTQIRSNNSFNAKVAAE